MMKLITNRGEELAAASAMSATMRGKARLIIELPQGMTMAQAATTLDGLAWIRREDDETPGVMTTYEGYNRIAMLSRGENGAVRATLERGD